MFKSISFSFCKTTVLCWFFHCSKHKQQFHIPHVPQPALPVALKQAWASLPMVSIIRWSVSITSSSTLQKPLIKLGTLRMRRKEDKYAHAK